MQACLLMRAVQLYQGKASVFRGDCDKVAAFIGKSSQQGFGLVFQ
jgi:hypothetical protein